MPMPKTKNRKQSLPQNDQERRMRMGRFFQTRRELAGYTIEALAMELGIEPSILQSYERGSMTIPLDDIFTMTNLLNIPPEDVLTLINDVFT